MKAGEKNYLKESNGTKANCNANVTQVRKSRIYINIHVKGTLSLAGEGWGGGGGGVDQQLFLYSLNTHLATTGLLCVQPKNHVIPPKSSLLPPPPPSPSLAINNDCPP